MKKAVAVAVAAAGIAAGSFAVGVANPFGSVSAQTTPSTTAPPTTAPGATTPATPKVAPKKALSDALDALVADGTLTRAQADKVLAKLETTLGEFKGPRGPGGPGGLGFGRGFGIGMELDTAAKFLGITTDELKTKLEAGQTLAQIAGDKKDGLIAAMVDAANKKIDDAVTAGKLTADQATKIKAGTTQLITGAVNGTLPKPPHGFGDRGPKDQQPAAPPTTTAGS